MTFECFVDDVKVFELELEMSAIVVGRAVFSGKCQGEVLVFH